MSHSWQKKSDTQDHCKLCKTLRERRRVRKREYAWFYKQDGGGNWTRKPGTCPFPIKSQIADVLKDDGAAWTVTELANWLGVSVAGSSRAVAALHRDGLIAKVLVREGDPPNNIFRYNWTGRKRDDPRLVQRETRRPMPSV